MTKLSSTQEIILKAAAEQRALDIREHMAGLKNSTIKDKVLQSMLKNGFIYKDKQGGKTVYLISDAGLKAIGQEPTISKKIETPESVKKDKEPKITKKQTILDLLSADGGTTLKKLMEKTSWQQHTVRGHIANMRKVLLKDKRDIVSTKDESGERIYKLVDLASKNAA